MTGSNVDKWIELFDNEIRVCSEADMIRVFGDKAIVTGRSVVFSAAVEMDGVVMYGSLGTLVVPGSVGFDCVDVLFSEGETEVLCARLVSDVFYDLLRISLVGLSCVFLPSGLGKVMGGVGNVTDTMALSLLLSKEVHYAQRRLGAASLIFDELLAALNKEWEGAKSDRERRRLLDSCAQYTPLISQALVALSEWAFLLEDNGDKSGDNSWYRKSQGFAAAVDYLQESGEGDSLGATGYGQLLDVIEGCRASVVLAGYEKKYLNEMLTASDMGKYLLKPLLTSGGELVSASGASGVEKPVEERLKPSEHSFFIGGAAGVH